MHTTGPLYQWIEANHPEWFDLVKKLVDSGQMEVLSGGFYEPILSVIPQEDAIGQILTMSKYVEAKFGVVPQGMWTAERIWEPGLPSIMAQSGIAYTLLDDTHFKWAGLKDDNLLGHYITEDQGFPSYVFPISKFLRYSIPFMAPEKTIQYLKDLYDSKGDIVVVYADDGEKFGVWPGTYETCYNKRWLQSFFHQLTENIGWIKPVFLSEAISEVPPVGRVYLPTSSYAEMGQWSLPPEGFREFEDFEKRLKDDDLWDKYAYLIRGGFWRNFMSKYPEANNMHKKMLHVTGQMRKYAGKKGFDKKALGEALDLKWQGQCNCPYWHGVFGGLYLNHLRHATYSRFIEAEILLEKSKKDDFLEYELLDFDYDGKEEAVLRNRFYNLYISPAYGGGIFELDYKPAAMNLLDTMSRHEEGYHSKIYKASESDSSAGGSIHDRIETKEAGLDKYLIYDWHRRISLLDHFFDIGTELGKFAKNEYNERGNFVNQTYAANLLKKKDALQLVLARNGNVWINNIWAPILLAKAITLKANNASIEIEYRIENRSEARLESLFAVETAWALLAGNSPDRYYHIAGEKLEHPEMLSSGIVRESDSLSLRDDAFGYNVELKTDRKMDWWRFPIETVSLSEAGFERIYQQSTVLPVVKLDLSPGEAFGLLITISIEKL